MNASEIGTNIYKNKCATLINAIHMLVRVYPFYQMFQENVNLLNLINARKQDKTAEVGTNFFLYYTSRNGFASRYAHLQASGVGPATNLTPLANVPFLA
jgi:hypothetical protein